MKKKYNYLHKISNFISKTVSPRYFCLLLLVGIISIVSLNSLTARNSYNIQKGIAEEVIRFHVVANSNSKQDQELKLNIKDYVTKELEPLLKDINSVNGARDVLEDNISSIESMANEIIYKNGFDYSAKASLEYDYFPLKVYGDIALPPGEYETVRIDIGSASGRNWWCIMFPPLCFVDSTHSIVPESSKEQLSDVLTEEEYDELLISEDDEVNVEIKFKIFTFLNDFFD